MKDLIGGLEHFLFFHNVWDVLSDHFPFGIGGWLVVWNMNFICHYVSIY